jgi:hypothetical protein
MNPWDHKESAAVVLAMSVLSPSDQKVLAECEAMIERGWRTFMEVGQALSRIRDQKLYRAQHDTFELYCREKWQFGRAHAYRLMSAAEVAASLSPIGDIRGPTHEAQVRPLMGLEAEQARKAWRRAVERANGAMITAKLVRNALAEVFEFTPQTPPKLKTSTPSAEFDPYDRKIGNALELVKQIEKSLGKTQALNAAKALLTKLTRCLETLRPT